MSKRLQHSFQRHQRTPDLHAREGLGSAPSRTPSNANTDHDATPRGDHLDSNAQRLADLHIGLMRLGDSLCRLGREDG